MTLIICQKKASELLVSCCKITKTRDDDIRGWYIVANDPGTLYLHNDGVIRNGVVDNSGFWPTKKDATKFYQKWLEKYNNKIQSDGKSGGPCCDSPGREKCDQCQETGIAAAAD